MNNTKNNKGIPEDISLNSSGDVTQQFTNLPNHPHFISACKEALLALPDHTYNPDQVFACLILLNIDDLLQLNNTIDNKTYIDLLDQYTKRIETLLKPGDHLAELGPAVFGVLLTSCADSCSAAKIAQKMQETINAELTVAGVTFKTNSYLGVSVAPRDGTDVSALFRTAELALESTITAQKSGQDLEGPGFSQSIQNTLSMELRLRKALTDNKFKLLYQAIVLPEIGQVVGAEAIIRLEDRDNVITMPSSFIPVLEETGLIIEVGQWIIDQACQQLKLWQNAGYHDLFLSINISPKQFNDDRLADFILRALESYGLPACNLVLEITEEVMIADSERARRTISRLKEAGVATLLDNFGTGYSSLSHLKNLPISGFKVNQKFIKNLPNHPKDSAIALSMISLAKNMGLWVIAEGIETQHQRDFLQKHGIELMQGFLFSHPLPAKQLTQKLPFSIF